jgi:hypothetical protein
LTHSGTSSSVVTAVDFAAAVACFGGPGTREGTGNVDLRGTPFALTPGDFCQRGFLVHGSITMGADNLSAELTGGGFCGSVNTRRGGEICGYVPVPNLVDPGGERGLDLIYVGL